MHTHKTQISWASGHLSLAEGNKERKLLMWNMSGVKEPLIWHFFQKTCGSPESPHYLEPADNIKNFTAYTLLGFIFNSQCKTWKATKRKSDTIHSLSSVTKNVNIVNIGRGKANLECASELHLKDP